ncbi:peptide ABC transporter substrate-binding protein [Clostridium sulfidigenes]|uniref:Peptide ABC transporter substrate-binding protein n=1 Tax=Clostridium sulfidigenes TaxID=318464 RepID=A0A084JBB8_9CLOT|nr:peptide ABC transporter substrate-binding protein [Clostridium sulfidigenes]KEZ86252.1 peptide ABC transporter substrate-binding protein [Clostridium sulfidigenes]HCO74655.1 peptide ABC transporter substrate-binding protein [Clostridium sp.]
MKKTRIMALIMTAIMTGTLLLGCTKTKENEGEKPGDGNTPVVEETVEQKIVYNLGADPKTIDPQLNSAVDGSTIIHNAFEGLMREDENSKIVPGTAEKYEVSDDGTVYTFHIRKDAKWSDGKPVVAGDFEYAWKRALNPKVAAEYAYQLFYIKNGAAYYNQEKVGGKVATAEDVGVKVIDDNTLEVTLEAPVPYFLSLAAFPTYFPVRKDIIEGNEEKWTLKPDTYISNGPFKMSEWKEKESITFVKNENYWDAKNVKLETLEVKLIDDQITYLNAFKSGEIDVIESPPQAEIPTLLDEGTAKIYPYLGTYFYVINVSDKAKDVDPKAAEALSNPKFRKALSLAIDRQLIVDKVAQGGQAPATSYVPAGILDSIGEEFQKDYSSKGANIEEAKKLLEEAGYPNGEGAPTITFTFNTDQGHQNIAQAVQDMWKTNLGINVELKNEEWAVFQDTRNNFQYSMARHGWIADYNDPMTFLDMWTTGNGQNNAGYSNKEYDKLIAQAKVELDDAKRTELLHKAEDILMDESPIIPLYYYTNVLCIDKNVKGTYKSPLGQMEFRDAYVE